MLMRRLALAMVCFGLLELASFATVLAIGRSAPTDQEVTVETRVALGNCVQYVLANVPVIRCPGA
jgi:hypothetical protein